MDLSGVDLNLLVAFDALLAERHVTRAAVRLSVGQSAMSATLNRLRKLFNDPILIRQGRELVATPFAEALAEPVRDILSQIESVLARDRGFDPATSIRTFSITASDYITLIFLHPLLRRLADAAPNVTLQIRPVGDDFAEKLRQHETDLLILPSAGQVQQQCSVYRPLCLCGCVGQPGGRRQPEPGTVHAPAVPRHDRGGI